MIVSDENFSASEKKCPGLTICQLVDMAEKRCANTLALAVERPCPKNDGVAAAFPLDKWLQWNWAQYVADIKTTAKAFIAFGAEMHGAVTIFGFNAPEWHLSSLGIMMAGGKCAGVYPTDTVWIHDVANSHPVCLSSSLFEIFLCTN